MSTLLFPLVAWAAFPLAPLFDRFGDPLPTGAIARLGFVRTSTSSPLNIADGPLAVFSSDGRYFASACYNRVYVWDVATGRVHRRFTVGNDHVGRLVFGPGGRELVGQSRAGRFHRWRLDTGREEPGEVEGTALWGDARMSPGGRWLLSPQGGVWDLTADDRASRYRLPIHKGQASLAYSADERWLFVAGREDGKTEPTLDQWDLSTGKRERVVPGFPTGSIASSPDGGTIAVNLTIPDAKAVTGFRYTVAVFDTATGREQFRLPAGPAPIDRPVFSADGRRFAAAVGREKLHVWDAGTGKAVATWTYPRDHLAWLAFAPDGRSIGGCGEDGTAVVWDVATGKPRFLTPEVPYRVSALAFSPDGRQLAAGYSDGAVRLWDLGSQQVRHEVRNGESPAYSGITDLGWAGPAGPLIYRGFRRRPGEIRLLDPVSGAEASLALGDGVEVRAVSAAGRTVAVGPAAPGGGDLRGRPVAPEALDAARRAVRARPELTGFRVVTPAPVADAAPPGPLGFRLRSTEAQVVVLSPDGEHAVELVMTMGDAFAMTNAGPQWSHRGLRVVDLATGRVVRELGRTPQHALAFTPDGRGLVFWRGPFTDYVVELLEARTGKVRWTVSLGKPVGNVAVSPDGRWLAATESEGDAFHLVDAATGKTVATHTTGRLYNGPDPLAFSPDGRLVARSAQDGTILVWRVPSSPARASGDLTAADLADCWRDLAADDAAAAFRALVRLADARASAVPPLRRELLREDDRERIERLIAGLNAAAYPDRERAERELESLGAVGRPFVVKGMRARPSLEARTRLERLLAAQPDPFATPAGLRQLRAVEALERIGTADARQVLERLAEAGPEDPLAHEAGLSLGRMKR